MLKIFLVLILTSVLLSCASTPSFDVSDVDRALTPADVIDKPELKLGKIALWGGTILGLKNLKESTQIEMLAYPLDSSHRPRLEEKTLGRFIIQHQGYLEPEVFTQGKQLSVVGEVGQSVTGKIGDSDYTYPLIHSRNIRLWTRGAGRTNFQFGIGIHLSN